MSLFKLRDDFSFTDSALVWLTVTHIHHTCPSAAAQCTHGASTAGGELQMCDMLRQLIRK